MRLQQKEENNIQYYAKLILSIKKPSCEIPEKSFFFFFFFLYIQQIKDTTHNKSKRKILTHGQIRTLNQTIQINRYQSRTPQGTMRYRQSPGPTKKKLTIN